jgi:glycerate 2-kinase
MQLPELARQLARAALAAVDPERLAREELGRRGETFDAALAIGKAAAALARGAPRTARRLLIQPRSSPSLPDPGWEQMRGGHPLPDRRSLAAGERLAGWLAGIAPSQRLLALISGGASACLEKPVPGLALDDLTATQRALLASGLPIHSVNAVRKHLSLLKGGGALRVTRGRVLALLLSDVPGDDPGTLASGPFAADPTTFAQALEAVEGLPVPEPVRRYLAAGARGEVPETVKPGDPVLERVETVLLAGGRTAARAVLAEARRHGLTAAGGDLTGEAAVAGRELVARGRSLGERAALVLAGETTVTLGPAPRAGHGGRGGRNGELALAAARELAAGSPGSLEAVLALATDGEDGPTRYAGAVVDNRSWEGARRAGVDPEAALERHDSYTALAAMPGAVLETGPTGTNVADLAVYLRLPASL